MTSSEPGADVLACETGFGSGQPERCLLGPVAFSVQEMKKFPLAGIVIIYHWPMIGVPTNQPIFWTGKGVCFVAQMSKNLAKPHQPTSLHPASRPHKSYFRLVNPDELLLASHRN